MPPGMPHIARRNTMIPLESRDARWSADMGDSLKPTAST
jgi:hypothetical protein